MIGLLQGVTELFPVSSLGHSVLLPAWLGWHAIVGQQSAEESPYLAFLVGLHVATALALLVFFRAEWVRIVRGLWRSLVRRKIDTADERLAARLDPERLAATTQATSQARGAVTGRPAGQAGRRGAASPLPVPVASAAPGSLTTTSTAVRPCRPGAPAAGSKRTPRHASATSPRAAHRAGSVPRPAFAWSR